MVYAAISCLLTLVATDLLAQEADVQRSDSQLVTVTLLNGEATSGKFISLDGQTIEIEAENQRQKFDVQNLERIQLAGEPENPDGANLQIRLVDGSLLLAKTFTIQDRIASVAIAWPAKVSAPELKIETRNIEWIRLGLEAAMDKPWREAVAKAPAGDTLFIRKENMLEPLDGIIQDVDADAIQFKFDGELIPVKRAKVAGLAFYHAAGRKLPVAACLCRDRFGNQFIVRSFRLDQAENFALLLNCGTEILLPLDILRDFDFTVGKILYVSDMDVEAAQWLPQVESGPLFEQLSLLMTWQRDRSLDKQPLKLFRADGFREGKDQFARPEKEFAKGIAVRSGTKLLYNVPEGFKTLTGLCGIDPELRPRGHVVLKIVGDGRELYAQPISGRDAQPNKIDLDISGVSRLMIHVDYGENSDVADHLNICNLRFAR